MCRQSLSAPAASLLAIALFAGASLAYAAEAPSRPADSIVLKPLPEAPVTIANPIAEPIVHPVAATSPSGAPAAPARSSSVLPRTGPAATKVGLSSAQGLKTPAAVAPNTAQPSPEASTGAPAAAAAPPPPLEAVLADLVHRADKKRNALLRKNAQAIEAYYSGRNFAPVWLAGRSWSAAALAVSARLRAAAEDGLEPASLHIPALDSGGEQSRLAAEVALSRAVVLYGEQASGGRIDPRTISSYIEVPHTRLSPADILARIVNAADPARALADLNPPQPGFRALRSQLALLRAARAMALGATPSKSESARVRAIQATGSISRSAEHDASPQPGANTQAHAGVAAFQRLVGLAPNGVMTARTRELLAGSRGRSIEEIIEANMEFWRWQPRHMGQYRIEVNIPDYGLTLYQGDKAIHHAKVVVGKPKTPTPVFSDEIRYIVVNPSWYVPQSIIQKEMLPKFEADPDYFRQMRLVVTQQGDGIAVRQLPGPRNALGQIKFVFPNHYAVYLHDTDEKNLFRYAKRAFSHGCVRMQDPFALAGIVLGRERGWNEARVKALIGDQTRTLRLATPIPIHIEYFSAFVDADGRLQLRDDIYGYTRKMEAALRSRA